MAASKFISIKFLTGQSSKCPIVTISVRPKSPSETRGKYFFLRGGFLTGGLSPTVTGKFANKTKKTEEIHEVLHDISVIK